MTGVVDIAQPEVREGQVRSPFTVILETLCDSCVGAVGAGLIDEEGECVDFAFLPSHDLPAYTIKLCGAHLQIVMRDALNSPKLTHFCGSLQQMWIHADEFSYVVCHMLEGYVLVLILRPDALASVSRRALRQVEVEIYGEAGWPLADPEQPYWRRAHVHLDAEGHPEAIRFAHGFMPHNTRKWDARVRVVSELGGLASFERGYEVLASTGKTIHLVREPSGYWYAGSLL